MRATKTVRTLATAAVASLLLAACGGGSGSGSGDTYEFTLSIVGPETGMIDGTNWWATEIEERTDGRITFDIFYNESLLTGPETLDGIREGRITGGWYSDAYYPKELPLFQISGLPFETSDSYAYARALYQTYQENDEFRGEIQATGVHIAHFVPYSQTIFATTTPLESADDLNGKRYRAAGILAEVLKQFGSDAVFLDVTELYESIERGVIDGAAGFPFDIGAAVGLAEAAPHITDIGYGHYAATGIAVDLDWYESLPEDLRSTFDEVSRELQEERAGEFLTEVEKQACDTYEDQGARINVWSDDQTDELRQQVGDAFVQEYKETAVSNGADAASVDEFYKQFHSLYEEYAASSTYQNFVVECAERLGGQQ